MSFITTLRPMPARRLPILAGGLVIALAFLVFLVADWDIRGWALGAVLWVAFQGIGYLLNKAGIGQPTIEGSGVVAFGMMGRAIVLMVVLLIVAVSNPDLALAGALVYAAAFTAELAFGLSMYFQGESKESRPS